MFQRIDMPGHIKHTKGDTFSEVYLSYYDATNGPREFSPPPAAAASSHRVSSSRTSPRTRSSTIAATILLRQGAKAVPERFIRAYHLRDAKTGKAGPWLAGMTLDPAAVYEAWCHQRGYVCLIEEFGGRPIKAGESFSAAFIVGFFDSIEEMHERLR